ncbi:hypothetical protein [Dyella sp. EPa41]|uniref:hypothetical protein n=1 Tax=Dyella sp. EPa41 TaxID=1561194 RepID=UPI00191604CC|nr:hypothetical protein [Dyella sp. EPa41]
MPRLQLPIRDSQSWSSLLYGHLLNAGLHKGKNPAVTMQHRNIEPVSERYLTEVALDRLAAAPTVSRTPPACARRI